MRHHPLFHLNFRHWELPLRRSCGDQHGTRASACFAHRQPQVLEAGGAAGHHQTKFAHGFTGQVLGHFFERTLVIRVKRQAIGGHRLVVVNIVERRLFYAHLVPTRIQFICQQHGQTGVHTLAHFAAGHHHRDAVVCAYAYPAVESRLVFDIWQRGGGHQSLTGG